ncbi:hypothetical protein LNP26_17010 [Klebsiella variicola subsp. variicola]|nr:hypothetical protein [Klebsiella variicola subsp. variicola]
MQVAYTVKLNSGCISRQVGAVVTDNDNSIKSVGWNDVAKGQMPCSMRSLDGVINDFDSKVYSSYERNDALFRKKAKGNLIKFRSIESSSEIFKGRNLSYCFKDVHNSLDDDKKRESGPYQSFACGRKCVFAIGKIWWRWSARW